MAEQAKSVHERMMDYLAIEDGEQPEVADKEKEPEISEPENELEGKPESEPENEPEGEPGGKTEEEVIQISSLKELRDNIEDLKDLSDADLYALTFPVTLPDGTSKNIPLGEVKDSYQASELLKTERERFAHERANFEKESAQKKQDLDAAFYTASKILEETEQAVLSGWNESQMNDLRVNDPAEYALALTERDRKKSQLDARKTQLINEYSELVAAQQRDLQAKQAESTMKARQSMPQFIPEWSDEKVVSQEIPKLIDYGMGEGYDEQELRNIVDPRIVRTLRKAMLYDEQQKAKPEVKKKVVSIGKKVIGSGKSRSKTERKSDSLEQDMKKFRKGGGKVSDAAAIYEKHFMT